MSNMPVAVSRLGDELRRLRAHLDTLDREERANRFAQSDYARLRMEQIHAERDSTEAEIAALEALTDDEIVARFNPPPPPDQPDAIRPADLLARGELAPQQVVVSRSVPAGYRTAEPAPADPVGWAQIQAQAN